MSEGSLFKLHICMEIDLRRLGRFMAEPKSNHGEIHTVAEQGHRGRVAQGVRRYLLRYERWTGLTRSSCMS